MGATITSQLAKHLREVHFGGNWTAVCLKESLEGVSWEQATTKVHALNNIVALVYHMNYYVQAILGVLEGGPLDSKDEFSFQHPPVATEKDWQELQERTWSDVRKLAALIEQFPDEKLTDIFTAEKYGNYFRNFTGLLEHSHYHLGQVVLIKKIVQQGRSDPAY